MLLPLLCMVGALFVGAIGCDEGDIVVQPEYRVVHGVVAANGTVSRGTGFTVGHLAPGGYGVTFDLPFSEAPTVVVTAEPDPSEKLLVAGVTNVTTDDFDVQIANTNYLPVLMDAEFHFVAIGPW